MEIKEIQETQELQDRIGEFLLPHVEDFLFDELSYDYLKKAEIDDILTDIPVPIRKKELSGGLTTLKIAQNMAFIIGCDINFQYKKNYIAYIERMFTKEFVKPLINDGIEGAAKHDFDYACICFRAAILIDPENVDALYCYGRACKDSYEIGEGEDYVGRYKAEALEAFEKVTIKKPDFDMGFYFLGYAYLNLGLYVKAKLTWDTFLELSKDEEMKKEVSEWMSKLEDPVKIEQGYNDILAGRFDEGLAILEEYAEDERFNTWWPMWYYLGVGYKELERFEDSEEALLKVLKLSPSNAETMEELVHLYTLTGNDEKKEKYEKKIEVVKHNRELDKAERGRAHGWS